MNQDALLERLWVEVINAVDGVALSDAPLAEPRDVQHVARLARYEALFGWCAAFDEEGHTVSWWLKRPAEDPVWLELSTWTTEAAARCPKPRPDEPFADASEAWARLLEVPVNAAALAAWLTVQGQHALTQLREILASQKWKTGELSGPHEGLLSADPSGLEARPGSWPLTAAKATRSTQAKAEPPRQGPRLALKKSHALAFSPDGARIVAATGGAITEVASGKVLAKCALLANTSHITWSPDGKWIAATSTSGDIAVCAAETGKRVRVLSQKGEGVAPVFTRERELVGATWGGDVLRWDVEQGRFLGGVSLSVSMLLGLDRTEDGALVVLVRTETDAMGCLRLDPELKASLSALPVPSWANHVSHDGFGGRALIAGQSHAAWLDLGTGKLSESFDSFGPMVQSAVSPDGKWVAFANLQAFRISPADDLAAGRTYAMAFANAATFSADSRQIALATWQAGEVWDVEALFRAES
jgi:hypothetical protein